MSKSAVPAHWHQWRCPERDEALHTPKRLPNWQTVLEVSIEMHECTEHDIHTVDGSCVVYHEPSR